MTKGMYKAVKDSSKENFITIHFFNEFTIEGFIRHKSTERVSDHINNSSPFIIIIRGKLTSQNQNYKFDSPRMYNKSSIKSIIL